MYKILKNVNYTIEKNSFDKKIKSKKQNKTWENIQQKK